MAFLGTWLLRPASIWAVQSCLWSRWRVPPAWAQHGWLPAQIFAELAPMVMGWPCTGGQVYCCCLKASLRPLLTPPGAPACRAALAWLLPECILKRCTPGGPGSGSFGLVPYLLMLILCLRAGRGRRCSPLSVTGQPASGGHECMPVQAVRRWSTALRLGRCTRCRACHRPACCLSKQAVR